jgi:dienelactone hydrolase
VRNIASAAVLFLTLLAAIGAGSRGATAQSSGSVVELETPLAASPPLHGFLRVPNRAGNSPAVVLLHSCNGDFRRIDERWGRLIASWGYVTLAVDSSLKSTCGNAASELAFDAYRALDYLVQQSFVDPARVVALGFSQGGWLALSSVERGPTERFSTNKFRAAIGFYPPCRLLGGNMTVPSLVLVGEFDDWALANDCRKLVEGNDDLGVSRQKGQGIPIKLIVLPGAHHGFDAPNLAIPKSLHGHHLEFSQSATDLSVTAVREFLDAMIGDQGKAKGTVK